MSKMERNNTISLALFDVLLEEDYVQKLYNCRLGRVAPTNYLVNVLSTKIVPWD
jgi:hypothetical protein